MASYLGWYCNNSDFVFLALNKATTQYVGWVEGGLLSLLPLKKRKYFNVIKTFFFFSNMRVTILGYNGWDVTRAEGNYCVFIYLSFITAGTLLHFNIKMSPAPLNTTPDGWRHFNNCAAAHRKEVGVSWLTLASYNYEVCCGFYGKYGRFSVF